MLQNLEPRRHLGSIDILRIVATALILVQHSLTVLDRYDDTFIHGVNIGQIGVGIFCAISGWFALDTSRTPICWLRSRLTKIFPAYWLVTLAAFAEAYATHRPFTAGLFASQMLGLGYFTHGWELINVVSWFISLLLLCYALVFIGRTARCEIKVVSLAAAVSAALMLSHIEISLSRHVLTFCVAAIASRRGPAVLVQGALAALALSMAGLAFSYAAVSLLALSSFLGVDYHSKRLKSIGALTYEFFLTHGAFLAVTVKVLGPELISIAIAIVGACAASLVLNYVAGHLGHWGVVSESAGRSQPAS